MKKRIIELNIDENFDITNKPQANALGYLAGWACHSQERYAGKVVIHADQHGDLEARYHNPQGEMTYLIAGVYDADANSYSFHS